MARLGDNPLKTSLSGAEHLAAEDPSNDQDICITPLTLTQFAQATMGLANGSTNGLMSGPQATKLNALPDDNTLTGFFGQLEQVAVPTFFGAPSNGSLTLYQHVVTTPWAFSAVSVGCSAGSTNITIMKNGAGMPGLSNLGVTTAGATYSISDILPGNTLDTGDQLGITFAGTTGNCANVFASLKAKASLS